MQKFLYLCTGFEKKGLFSQIISNKTFYFYFLRSYYILLMQYELQKLERMSIDEVREIAVSMGLSPRRSQSVREISYAILDAQADQRAAVVQAKEEARAAAGTPAKRERKRGVKAAAQKVEVKAKNDHVATVGPITTSPTRP